MIIMSEMFVSASSSGALIRVMVVDDHQVVRQGFSVFIKAYPDMELVAEARHGNEALAWCEECEADELPHVVLMDMMMPGMDGVEATRKIRERYPEVQVIALTSFTDEQGLVQAALEAGAIAYLFKDISGEALAQAIRHAYQGTPTLAPQAARLLIQARRQRTPQDFRLSARELDVLRLMVSGHSNKQIADRLSISPSTIKFHVSSILGKLGASSRTEAVTIVHQLKLIG